MASSCDTRGENELEGGSPCRVGIRPTHNQISLAKPDFHTKNRRDKDNAQGGGGPLTVARSRIDSDAIRGAAKLFGGFWKLSLKTEQTGLKATLKV